MSSCSTCLSANGQEELSGVLGAIPSACSSYQQTCQKECAFDTCISTDVACQCSETYLANIYQCASCNTRNNNVGATQVTDYESLANSCGNQNYTVSVPSELSPGERYHLQPRALLGSRYFFFRAAFPDWPGHLHSTYLGCICFILQCWQCNSHWI